MRRAIRFSLAAALLGALLPAAPAPADHCTEDFVLISGRGLASFDWGWFGCVTWFSTGEEVDTDFIAPGANNMRVRVFSDDEPSGTLSFAGITGPTGDRGGCDPDVGACELRFVRDASLAQWNSQVIVVDATQTIDGGDAELEVCWVEGGCATRTYRTIQ